MGSRWLWNAASAACYVWLMVRQGPARAVFAFGISRTDALLWTHVFGYLVLGLLLLGAAARWWSNSSSLLWRPIMIAAGSGLAAAEAIVHGGATDAARVDIWMASMLGLLLAAILARLLPEAITRRWLGIDRRWRGC
ncbi:MAG: hypothetical protein ACYDDO_07935 [Acidiferrobacterales bacterium]